MSLSFVAGHCDTFPLPLLSPAVLCSPFSSTRPAAGASLCSTTYERCSFPFPTPLRPLAPRRATRLCRRCFHLGEGARGVSPSGAPAPDLGARGEAAGRQHRGPRGGTFHSRGQDAGARLAAPPPCLPIRAIGGGAFVLWELHHALGSVCLLTANSVVLATRCSRGVPEAQGGRFLGELRAAIHPSGRHPILELVTRLRMRAQRTMTARWRRPLRRLVWRPAPPPWCLASCGRRPQRRGHRIRC